MSDASPSAIHQCVTEASALFDDLERARIGEGLSEVDALCLLAMLKNTRLFLAQEGDNPAAAILLQAYKMEHAK